jgi:hypothetical protein
MRNTLKQTMRKTPKAWVIVYRCYGQTGLCGVYAELRGRSGATRNRGCRFSSVAGRERREKDDECA